MAKKYKTSLKRADVFFVDFDGSKLIKKIEAAGKRVQPALEKAAKRSLPLIQASFKEFMADHIRSGRTADSLIDPSQVEFVWGKDAVKKWVGTTTKGKKGFTGGHVDVVREEDVLFFEYGFDGNKGGFPAIFLDVGTPNRPARYGQVKPSYFIYYSVENNLKKIHAIQNEELMKIVKELE